MEENKGDREQDAPSTEEGEQDSNGGLLAAFLPIGMVFLILGLSSPNYGYLGIGIIFFCLALSGISGWSSKKAETDGTGDAPSRDSKSASDNQD